MVEVVHILRPAAAAAQQALAEVEAAMLVRKLVPAEAAAFAPVEAGVAVLAEAAASAEPGIETQVRKLIPAEAAALVPIEADPPVEELILSEVEPLARELAQEQELAAVGVHQAAKAELAQEQAPTAQDLL